MDAEEVSECLALIKKLQKEKKGNPHDLDNYKELLIENGNLHKSNVDYLKRLDGQIITKQTSKQNSERIDEVLVTTTEAIQGKTIDEYMGIVSGHAVMGMGFFKDIIGGIRDVIGGRSSSLEAHFVEARDFALDGMIDEAIKLGANAIVAVRFNDVSMEGKDRQMALVSVHGTAVRVGIK